MRTRKREIARAGVYGTKEQPKTVTAKDIREIAETFPEIHRVPIQFGHDANASSPRMGNVVSVYSDPEGQTLYADIEEHDLLANAVDSGYYPDVSIGAKQRAKDGKMYLHHLAYLGQEPPAIKDLIAEIQEPLGIDASDTEGLVFLPSPREFNLSDDTNQNKEHTSVTKEEAEKLKEENERLKKELEERELALSDSVRQKTEADIERLKTAMNESKIIRVQQERFLKIAGALDQGKTIDLSDGSGGIETMPVMDALIRVVQAIPPAVQTGMLNLNDLDEQGHSKRDYSRLRNKG